MNMYGCILYYGIGLNTSHRRMSGREREGGGEGLRGGDASSEKKETENERFSAAIELNLEPPLCLFLFCNNI